MSLHPSTAQAPAIDAATPTSSPAGGGLALRPLRRLLGRTRCGRRGRTAQ